MISNDAQFTLYHDFGSFINYVYTTRGFIKCWVYLINRIKIDMLAKVGRGKNDHESIMVVCKCICNNFLNNFLNQDYLPKVVAFVAHTKWPEKHSIQSNLERVLNTKFAIQWVSAYRHLKCHSYYTYYIKCTSLVVN